MKIFGSRIASTTVLLATGLLFASCKKKEETTVVAPTPPAEVQAPKIVPEPEPAPEPVEPVKPAVPEKFTSPLELAKVLTEQLQAGEMDAVKKLIGEDTLAAPSAFGFTWLFEEGGYAVNPGKPITDIGEISEIQRLALNIIKTEDRSTDKVFLDVTANPASGFGISAVKVPAALQALAHAALGSDPAAVAAQNAAITEDALTKAESFLDSVLTQNYENAVKICDPDKVPEEKIAALCIVFEEGSYRMKNTKPLMTTAVGDDASWVIAQVESDKLNTQSDFGIEMTRDAETTWKITGLNFSKMLSEYAKASDAGKVPYTPIIKNPKGGESLVLYFEYDDAALVPRAQRQIDIVSRILKSDPSKTLTITGHADALGTDDYNANLSANRAISVKEELIKGGVPENQIVTTGFGAAKPLRPNVNPDGTDNPSGRGQNRRAELFLNF